MAILIDEKKRVLVQGITGREGQARTKLMREYGTNVVAGVTPGKAGQMVLGVPVFDTPHEAVSALGKIDISVLFVPAAGVKEAAVSAIDAGIKLTVLVPTACQCGMQWKLPRRPKPMASALENDPSEIRERRSKNCSNIVVRWLPSKKNLFSVGDQLRINQN